MLGAIVIAGTNRGASGKAIDAATSRFGSNWGEWHTSLTSISIVGCSTVVRTVGYLKQSGVEEVSVVGGRARGAMAVVSVDGEAEAWSAAGRQVRAYREDGIEAVLLIRASGYFEFDVAALVAQHQQEGVPVLRAADRDGVLDVWVIDPSSFDDANLISNLETAPVSECAAGYFNRLLGPQDLRRLAADLLTGKCRMRPQGKEERPGVWIDEGAQVARGARVVAPAYIGKDAKVADDCLITRCSNVEDNCYVDFGTAVEDTSILSHTYVGIGLDLSHSVVDGEEVLNLHHQVRLRINDPVVVRRNSPRTQQHHRLPRTEVSEVAL